MPGKSSDAAYRRVDVEAETGKVKGRVLENKIQNSKRPVPDVRYGPLSCWKYAVCETADMLYSYGANCF